MVGSSVWREGYGQAGIEAGGNGFKMASRIGKRVRDGVTDK